MSNPKVKQGLITVENAGRLKRMLGLSAQIIVEHGPDLVGTFVPWKTGRSGQCHDGQKSGLGAES